MKNHFSSFTTTETALYAHMDTITFSEGISTPLYKGKGVSLHSHKDNCMGVRYYYLYLGKKQGGRV
jgi:hypothetical protein